MKADELEQINRYFAHHIRCSGVDYKCLDQRITLMTADKKHLAGLAREAIDAIAKNLNGQRVGVSHWATYANLCGDHVLSMTYRVL